MPSLLECLKRSRRLMNVDDIERIEQSYTDSVAGGLSEIDAANAAIRDAVVDVLEMRAQIIDRVPELTTRAQKDVNLNTDQFAAKFIPRQDTAPVDEDQLGFFNDLFGPQDAAPQADTLPTDAMRAAFSDVLATTTLPRKKWGQAVDERIEGNFTGEQLDVLIAEALDQGLLRESSSGRIARTGDAKTKALRPKGTVTETVTEPEISTEPVTVDLANAESVAETIAESIDLTEAETLFRYIADEIVPETNAISLNGIVAIAGEENRLAVSQAVDALVEQGLVRTVGQEPEFYVQLTDAGRAAVEQVVSDVTGDVTIEPEAPLDVSGLQSVEDLTALLKGYGIDTDAYGKNEAKSLNALLGELQKGESLLYDRNGKLVREVSSLALDIYVTRPDGSRLKLYEDRQDFRDGRTRRRKLDSSLGEKLEQGEDPQATIARALEEEIGVTNFRQTSDITSYNTQDYSPSYPGILGQYTTYRASVEIDPAEYRDEYVEEQAEKVNVMGWFPVVDGDERSPNIPGSPTNMEMREANARDYMQSGAYTFPEGGEAPKSLHGRTVSYSESTDAPIEKRTDKQPGYWSDEWKAKRRYNVKDESGNIVQVGFDDAIDWLERTFIAEAGGVDAIDRDRKAFIVIGLPGAGKSTLINPLREHVRAIHVVADETKKIIPEFEDGANSGGVHEESSDMTKIVQSRLMDAGYNVVLEKIGGNVPSIDRAINDVVDKGYTPQLFMVDVPTPVAMERAIKRFQDHGRAVGETVYDADISGVYTTLKVREEVTGYGRFEWKEPDGWSWQETGATDLRGFAFKDKFSGARIAYDRDGEGGVDPLDGPDRRPVDRETSDRAVQEEAGRTGELADEAREIPGFVASDLTDNDFARERAEAAIEAYETETGELADNQLLEDVLAIEVARGSVEAVEATIAEIESAEGFRKPDALRLANIVGYPTNSRTTKRQALDSIVERTRDMIANREVAELITEDGEEASQVPIDGTERVEQAAIGQTVGENPVDRMLRMSLEKGRSIDVPAGVQTFVEESISEQLDYVPEGYDVGIMTKIQPIGQMDDGLYVNVSFRDPRDGSEFVVPYRWADFVSIRAVRLPGGRSSTGRPAILTAARGLRGQSAESLRGVVWHELVHAYRSLGLVADFDSLSSHADLLGVMEMTLAELRDAGIAIDGPAELTLRQVYEIAYENEPDTVIDELVNQEAVAHMVELDELGHYTTEQLAPVREIIDAFKRGEVAPESQVGVTSIEDIPPTIDAPHPGPVLAYHSTPRSFEKFDPSKSMDIGVHFGSRGQAAGLMSDRLNSLAALAEDLQNGWRTFPVVLDIKNPVTLPDLGYWEPQAVLDHLERQGVQFTRAEQDAIARGEPEDERDMWEILQRRINAAGYDGIRYLNSFEGELTQTKDRRGMGTSGWSYIVWNRGAVRSAITDRELLAIRALHYSPYHFDRFDRSFIGAGEGAQVFGQGFYFAENSLVTDEYKLMLSFKAEGVLVNGRPETSRAGTYLREAFEADEKIERTVENLYFLADLIEKDPEHPARRMFGAPEEMREGAAQIQKWLDQGAKIEINEGALYDVEIDVKPEQLLDYDIELREQSPEIKEALKRVAARFKWEVRSEQSRATHFTPSRTVYRVWRNDRPYGYPFDTQDEAEVDLERRVRDHQAYLDSYVETPGEDVEWMLRGPSLEEINYSPEANPDQGIARMGTSRYVSDLMVEEGIPGLRYFDQGSRTHKLGTRNIVVFDENLITIKAKNGEPVTGQEREMLVAAMRQRQQPENRAEPGAPVSERFAEMAPEFVDRLKKYASDMLPADVAVRLADHIDYMGQELDAEFSPMKRVVTLAMDLGPDRAFEVARHEAVHVARIMGLFSQNEWQILTERARKVDWSLDDPATRAYYETIYRDRGRAAGLTGGDLEAYVAEYIDQERVARMGEPGAKYGRSIDGMFQRIKDFFQALVNAARGLGFMSSGDIFRKLESGEIAARARPVTETAEGQSGLSAFGLSDDAPADVREWSPGDAQGTVEMRRTDDGRRVRVYKTPAGAASVVNNIDTDTWAVQVINVQDAASAAELIASIEDDLGQYLAPNGWLTTQQYERWLQVEPASVQAHQQTSQLWADLWAPPHQIELTASVASSLPGRMEDPGQSRKAARMAQELRSLRAKMVPGVLAAVRPQLPTPTPLASQTPADKKGQIEELSTSLSDLARRFNRHITGDVRTDGRFDRGMKARARRAGGFLAGLFDRATGVTRIAIPNDFVSLTHEGGHALETFATTRMAVERIKRQFAHELIMPPAPDTPNMAPLKPSGFSGLELDAETQDTLVNYYRAETAAQQATSASDRSMAIQDVELYGAILERHLGKTAADMAVNDLLRQSVPLNQASAYIAQRFSANGQPEPRAKLGVEEAIEQAEVLIADPQFASLPAIERLTSQGEYTADQLDAAMQRALEQGQVSPRSAAGRRLRAAQRRLNQANRKLSEAWADWFQDFMTKPRLAEKQSPALFDEFFNEIDGLDPELLWNLEEMQQGYQELLTAAPTSALRSRVKSQVERTRFVEAQERYDERRRYRGDRPVTGRAEAAAVTFSEELADYSYRSIYAWTDDKHPMKAFIRAMIRVAEENGVLSIGEGEKAFLRPDKDPYKLWRLSSYYRAHAMTNITNGFALGGSVDGVGPSLRDALIAAFGGTGAAQWSGEMLEKFGTYLVARRLLAEWRRLDRGERENEPDQLMSESNAQDVVRDLEAAHPGFVEGSRLIYEYQRNMLRYLYENGIISLEQLQDYLAREDYAPLNRIMDRFGFFNRRTGVNRGRVFYRFWGSTRDFINPIESIIQRTFEFQELVETNGVFTAMADLVDEAGPGAGQIMERIPATELKGTKVDVREAVRVAAAQAGVDKAALGDVMDEIDLIFDQEAVATVFRPVKTKEAPGEKIIWVYRNGEKIPYLLGNSQIAHDIYAQFETFGRKNTNMLMQVGVVTAQVLRWGVTKVPEYIYNNFFRDQLQTTALSKDFVPFQGFAGIMPVLRDDQVADRYNRFGGLMGGVDANVMLQGRQKYDIQTLRTKGFWNVPGRWKVARGWNTFMKFMEVSEAATRVAHYRAAEKRLRKEGYTHKEAAIEAAFIAEDVMPFGRAGWMMRPIAQIATFANAGVQGLSATARTISGDRDVPGEKWRPNPPQVNGLLTDEPIIKALAGDSLTNAEKSQLPNSMRVWIVAMGMVGVSIFLKYYYDDDEEDPTDDDAAFEAREGSDYREATHWRVRASGLKAYLPESMHEWVPNWVYFPKPHDLAVPANFAEKLFEWIAYHDETAPERFMASLPHTVVPPHEINAMSLIGELRSGQSYFGNRPIEPYGLRGVEPKYRADEYTSEIAKLMAQNSPEWLARMATFGASNQLSPKYIDHTIAQGFGSMGRNVQSVSNWLGRSVLPEVRSRFGDRAKVPQSMEVAIEDMPILQRNFGRASKGSRSMDYFWRDMSQDSGKLMLAAGTLKNKINSALERPENSKDVRDYIAGLDERRRSFALVEAYFKEPEQDLHPMNRAKQITSISSKIRRAMISGNLVREETRKRLQERELIELSPSQRKHVSLIFEQISLREVHNAAVLTKRPGWVGRKIWSVDPLLDELKDIAPDVYDEYRARLRRVGRNRVYSFEAVRDAWPEAEKRLLAEGGDADLSDLVADAKARSID